MEDRMENEGMVETRLAYMGRRLNSKGGLSYAYRVLATGEDSWYLRNLWPGARIGTVIVVPMNSEGSVQRQHATVESGSIKPELADQWAAQEAAELVIRERHLLSKRNARGVEAPLEDALSVLREAYNGVSGLARKAAFLDWVNASIQGVK